LTGKKCDHLTKWKPVELSTADQNNGSGAHRPGLDKIELTADLQQNVFGKGKGPQQNDTLSA